MLGAGDTFGINGSFDAQWKTKTKCCLSLHYNVNNSYLFVDGKKIFKFKADNGNINFPTEFCLGCIFNAFGATESRKVSREENVYDFLAD